MADSLAVRRKKEQDKRIQQITRGQTLSVRRPGVFERIYDYIDQPLEALAKRLGMSEADAYEYSKRLSGAVEGLTGADATEMSARRVSKGKGDTGDYINLGMAVLPGAIGAGAKKAKTALRGAKAAKEAKSMAVKALPAPPTPLALPAPGPGLPPFAVKPKGGQWFIDKPVSGINFSPENAARGILARARRPDDTEGAALYDWWQKALPRYLKNEMGTPEDPLRDLAARNLLHIQKSPDEWSQLAGSSIRAPNLQRLLYDEGSQWKDELISEMPWLQKVPATDNLYAMQPTNYRDLEFGHVADELENALNPARSGLPPELALRPESLQRMSFPAAVERVGRINQFRAKKMEETALNSLNNPAVQMFKEYTENNPLGLRWVELRAPEPTGGLPQGWKVSPDEDGFISPEGEFFYTYPGQGEYDSALQQALKYEGDTMGHCVGNYCPDVMEGRSRIFSLRDAKGEPHVTIETAPKRAFGRDDRDAIYDQAFAEIDANPEYRQLSPEVRNQLIINRQAELADALRAEREANPVEDIIQIKGKQNRAPKDDYLPFVQDFVKSQQWGNVRDLENTGLVRLPDGRYITVQQAEEGVAAIPERTEMRRAFASREMVPTRLVYNPSGLDMLSEEEWSAIAPYFEGFAIGGRVERDRCFCRHPMAAK